MESLMREIAGEAAGSSSDKDVTEEERNRAFKAAWEAMLVDGMDGNPDGGLEGIGEALGKSEKKKEGPGGFQDKIKQAMDKLKESESKAQVRLLVAFRFPLELTHIQGSAGAGANQNPESIEALLQSLGDLGLGEGGENEAELAGFLESMMGQLMSKEVLYEPLKELAAGVRSHLCP
jgi:peroxin-19